MNFKITLLLLLVTGSVCAQSTSMVGRQSYSIYATVKRHHYKPVAVDDAFSQAVFDSYIEAIDPGGYYFLAADIEQLKAHYTAIDDEINAKTSVFFDLSATLFQTRLRSVDSILTVLENEKTDLTIRESISFAPEDYADYTTNYEELKERWRKWIKYEMLDELFIGDYLDKPTEQSTSVLLAKITEVKKVIFEYYHYETKSFLDHPAGYSNYLATYYLDAIATQFDPHTTYFSDIEKESFEEDLSKENLVFGFSVEEDDKGVIRIEGLTPGSPAWNSNQLNKGDELLSVKFSDGKFLDLSVAEMDDLILLFENTKADKVTLEIRKGNGELVSVELTKGEVYIEEDVIKNLVLDGEHRIGYITLPDFYMDWDGNTGLGCANDVAKSIVKLQQENIDGLILDLRNNGGGSLTEAIDLAGIFIDWGPLAIQQNKWGEATSIKDMNKGAIYTGPLLILVNGLSASASELFAAAMQDYNRAIIAGNPTYGKASSQIILPLDPNFTFGLTNPDDADPSFGFLKVTVEKFYRINNGTHQAKGVIPQVVMPDIYGMYDYRESSYANALQPDSVVKKVYYTPFPAFSADVFAQSRERIEQHAGFSRMVFLIDSLSKAEDESDIISLHIEDYLAQEKKYAALIDELYGLEQSVSAPYKAINNRYDLEILNMDAYRRTLNEEYIKTIEADVYINEAYLVLTDYLKK